jgi:plastocyanin
MSTDPSSGGLMRRVTAGAIAAVIAVVIGAAQASAGDTAGKSGRTVSATNYEFTPKTSSVSAGSKVTWTAKQGRHTVTFKGGGLDAVIDTSGDASVSAKFKRPGTYKYVCRFHREKDMRGKVVVK